ncbi:MAG: divergent polysaccharide deacetylase family protein [Candidatus Thiodiazotropha sp. DIVDIV]
MPKKRPAEPRQDNMVKWYRLIGFLVAVVASPTLQAELLLNQPIKIAVIIDDLGNQKQAGERALELPGPVTYAFLPQTPFTWQLATMASEQNKEVMLHLPMESDLGNRLGEGALTLGMPKPHFLETLKRNIASVPYLMGVNNHMGSLLTRDPTAMRWLMSELRRQGLYFVDSRTTEATVAQRVARSNMIANARRDVFLDNVPDEKLIRKQFQKLVDLARERGSAIGIGHPYAATISVLREALPKLKQQGIELVPVSELLSHRRLEWHVSSSPSLKDVKSSKPSPSPIF